MAKDVKAISRGHVNDGGKKRDREMATPCLKE
jgi:hypothetical protein